MIHTQSSLKMDQSVEPSLFMTRGKIQSIPVVEFSNYKMMSILQVVLHLLLLFISLIRFLAFIIFTFASLAQGFEILRAQIFIRQLLRRNYQLLYEKRSLTKQQKFIFHSFQLKLAIHWLLSIFY